VLAFIAKRLGLALLVALAVSVIAFALVRLSGDVASAIAGEGARMEDVEAVRLAYGLDRPLIVQYFEWLWRTLGGDFGTSLYFKTDVIGLVLDKLPTTLLLGVLSLAFALLISVPLGVAAAVYQNSWIDRLALALAVVGQALPNFFFALLLIMLFSIQLRWLPVSGSGSWAHFVMPTIALGYYVAPAFMRLTRAGMVEVLSADYIRTARAKGLPERRVVLGHGMRAAVTPIVTVLGLDVGILLGGAILTETVFNLPGVGRLAYDAIQRADLPVIQGTVLFGTLFIVVANLVVDVAYAFLDPRVRYS
jgi:ABC-type dipeptide/oligopeptide/nickel transport system permease component